MKIKSILVITAGILIAGYPTIQHTCTYFRQQALLREWEDRVKAQNNILWNDTDDASEEAVESFLVLDNIFSQASGDEDEAPDELPQEKLNSVKKPQITTLGILDIEKINVHLPILDGSTPDKLKVGAGKLNGTSDIGEIGNTAISAHRSHKYGLNFNRLDEVELGDPITITTQQDVFTYEVFNIQIVEPDDISVLNKSQTDSILTLITCHPLYTASHRLIVQARLLEKVSLS